MSSRFTHKRHFDRVDRVEGELERMTPIWLIANASPICQHTLAYGQRCV